MIRLFYILLLCLPILSDTKFYVLGTGTPNPNPDRAGSAYLLVVNDEPYLFDFGANVTLTGKLVDGLKSIIELFSFRLREYAPLLYEKLNDPFKQK